MSVPPPLEGKKTLVRATSERRARGQRDQQESARMLHAKDEPAAELLLPLPRDTPLLPPQDGEPPGESNHLVFPIPGTPAKAVKRRPPGQEPAPSTPDDRSVAQAHVQS